MNIRGRHLFAVLALALLVAFALPVMAQEEVTPAPDPGTVVVSEDEGGNTTVTVTPSLGDYLGAGTLIAFVIGGIVGAVAGGGSAYAMVARVDKQTKDNIEKLHEGLSPTWKTTIDRILDHADAVAKTAAAVVALAKEVTDGLPNREPPPPAG